MTLPQTAGVPINENLVSDDTLNGDWDSENNYLPGVWTIGDILNENGYNQELLIGSKGTFAGRSSYFRGHGNYQIEDYDAVKEQGRLASDYKVWWGFEDEKLFEFAKEDALSLSKEDKPFNLTLLTVDTHATGGYKCELCEDEFDEQYSNVIACSDRQVADFVKWVQEQDFYENTTIVLCGDHLTPDSMYIGNIGAAGYDRKTYTAIINPEIDGVVVSKADYADARNYTTLDMYPTTLAAMGVKIEGNKLGLGVNLFSNEQTLAEKYGLEYLNTELMKPCKARSGIEKIRLTINAVIMAKSLNTRGRPFLGCSTLAFHLAIASSSIQKVSEPRLIKAWLYCFQLVVL